jgi:hypothetical protein
MNARTLAFNTPTAERLRARHAVAPALVESATRDPRMELLRGVVLLLLWAAAWLELPAAQALRQSLPALPWAHGVRLLDGLWVMGLAERTALPAAPARCGAAPERSTSPAWPAP